MNTQVIIPVVQIDKLNILLESIVRNTLYPTKIVIINNSGKLFHFTDKFIKDSCVDLQKDVYIDVKGQVKIERYTPLKAIGVNASWRYGFDNTKDADVVSVLNDDVVLNKYFFEKLNKVFMYKGVAAACPATVVPTDVHSRRHLHGSPGDIEICKRQKNRITKTCLREGWAFSLRRTFLDSVPPIPDELESFCGDDWYWHWALQKGKFWYSMKDNRCFHYVGTSVRKKYGEKVHEYVIEEQRILLKILRKKYKYKGYYPSKIMVGNK